MKGIEIKKIFISWSKKRSEEFAKIVKSTIEKLDSDIDFFMSEEDIKAGEFVQEKIILVSMILSYRNFFLRKMNTFFNQGF